MIRRILSLLAAIILMFVGLIHKKPSAKNPAVIADYVIDIGTITDFDESAANSYFVEKYMPKGGCTCVVTQVKGKNLIGRNMDLQLSKNTAIKFVLDINKYKSIGIVYSPYVESDFNEVKINGLSDNAAMVLPYIATDYMNEKGLYIESNMRNAEYGYSCTGTNPDSDVSVYAPSLPAYITSRCATVEEAVKLAKEINIFTSEKPEPWCYGFMLADANGNYGLLEIAKNKVIYTDKQNGQANFYVAPEFAENANYQSGKSRFEAVNNGLENITTPKQMLKQMEKVYFSQCYCFDTLRSCPFDVRSEFVVSYPVNDKGNIDMEDGSYIYCTEKWITDDTHADEVYNAIKKTGERYFSNYISGGKLNINSIREDEAVNSHLWLSAFSLAVDCSTKTITAHFWENTENTYKFTF